MTKYRVCFSVAGEIGAKITIEAEDGMSDEELAQCINKEELAKLMCLEAIGYSADDMEVISQEQYDAEFGGNEDDG